VRITVGAKDRCRISVRFIRTAIAVGDKPSHVCSPRLHVVVGQAEMMAVMMPRGPKGEKRPSDVIGAAIMVARIAIGEIEDKKQQKTRIRRRRKMLCAEPSNTGAAP